MGGVFSALFGSGGFIYAMYLSSRIEDKQRFRITQMTLIGFSTNSSRDIFSDGGVSQSRYFIDCFSVFSRHVNWYVGWTAYNIKNFT